MKTITQRLHKSLLLVLLICASQSLSARETYPLRDDWRLFLTSEGSGDKARSITLPYCWSLDPSTPVSMATANYLRRLYVPSSWRGKRVYIKFKGVQSVADLFVDGRHVGGHSGGATAFVFELTPFLTFDEDNTLILRVSSAAQNDILPTSVEHIIYGGVHREVELIVLPESSISPNVYGADGLFVTTRSIENEFVKGDVSIHFATPKAVDRRVEVSILDLWGREVFTRKQNKVRIDTKNPLTIPFQIDGAALWSPDEPALYDVVVRLSSVATGEHEDESQYDEVRVTTGFRVVSMAKDGTSPAAVRINGELTLLRGVSLYHDHPANGGILNDKTYRSDVNIIKDMGANAIRSAVVPHENYLYSLCDKEGIMAWVDTPLSRAPYLSDVAYFPTARFEENGLQQLREIIYQNYNHPSIVMWGIFSLLSTRGDDAVKYIERLNTEAKKIDPTRLTVALSDQNGALNEVTDLIVWRQRIGWDSGQLSDVGVWRDQLHERWGYMRSGVLYGEGGSTNHQADRSEIPVVRVQKRDAWFPEVRQSALHEEYTAQLGADSLMWGTWLSAMFDFKAPRNVLGENVEGLVGFDRSSRKDSYFLYRALWNKRRPTLHIAEKRARLVGAGDSLLTLRVYASDTIPPVAYIGQDTLTMRSIAPAQYVLDSVKVVDRTPVVVRQGMMRDEVEFIYGSPLRVQER